MQGKTQGSEALDLLTRVRRIEIKAKGLSEQVFAGQYHSAFRGRGMAFSEVRSYQVGDDVRDIDWNVTARHAGPFVKVFEEERELTVMLLIDLSGSTSFGTEAETKRELITEFAATIACSAIQNGDKVGAILFTDQVELFIPPRSGRKHILYIIRELLSFEPQHRATDLSVPLKHLSGVMKRRTTAFLISDFLGQEDNKQLLSMVARRHDLVAIRAFDKAETELPCWGLVQMLDAETGLTRWIDTASRQVRQAYKAGYEAKVETFRTTCQQIGIDHIDIATGEDFAPTLIRLFRRRS